MSKPRKSSVDQMNYIELVNQVRKNKSSAAEEAFNEIEKRMKKRITKLTYKFNIPGYERQDVYQESLIALRYKAIKDYDPSRGNDSGPYPFDNFALLCIRRHLSTRLKETNQHKRKVLNKSTSLDQDRNDGSDNSLYLSDILPKSEGTVLDDIESNEYHSMLFNGLFSKLSNFEKEVFILYVKRYSYEQISEIVSNNMKEKGKRKKEKIINVKSVDNALSRIKNKAREVFRDINIDIDIDDLL